MSNSKITTDAEFEADMCRLRELGAALLAHAGQHLPWPDATIYDQLIADLSPAARRAVA